MNKSILITGGAGFIGCHVVQLFVEKYPEYKIVNLDALTYAGNLENLKSVEGAKNYIFVPVVRCDYMPTQLGVHSVNVFFAGNPIPNSPFGVKVSVICNCIQSSICGTCIARLKILQQFFPKLFWIILVYLPVGSLFRNLSVT